MATIVVIRGGVGSAIRTPSRPIVTHRALDGQITHGMGHLGDVAELTP
ncbi:MAG: hypothetical protein R2789_16295 [Microthrixaceae bacterium]